jgi:hypothetical protein
VVNEWGSGTSLDILLADGEPLSPTVAAWIVAEVGDTLALAHGADVAHGRLVPENVLIDQDGAVRIIGFAVDAALHGLPAGRIAADEVDLVGLLYAGLTAKWAGVSRSAVSNAPSEHGRVLRPRQVRAGIPRPLDSLCDHVLNHRDEAEVSAAMVADSLRDFLGNSATAAEAWLARLEHPRPGQETVVLPPLADPPVRDEAETPTGAGHDDDHAAEDTDGEAAPVLLPSASPKAEEGLPTQAGLPIFHDDTDDVSWLQHRTEPAPPPPPFEPPPQRPLFAPEPVDGGPARRPRVLPPTDRAAGAGFWPWDTGTGGGTGSGVFAAIDDDDQDDRHPPGSSMLRLAGMIAACLLLLLGCVIAFNLGRGRTVLGTAPDSSSSHSGSPSTPGSSATAFTGVTARDFDPQGTPPEENPAEAPNVVDGDPSTTWQTLRYNENFGPGGLKTGVGVVLDLGAAHDVSEVDLTTIGSPTKVQIYVAPRSPANLQGLKPAGETTVNGTHGLVRLDPTVSGRYVVVWLTSLPAVPGGFRGEIAEAVVKGD